MPSVTLPNLTTMDPAMQNAYSRQANVEVERQIGERATVSAGYQYTGGRHLIISVNQNVPSCAAAGTNNGCRPNPSYGNNSQYSPAARSSYHGLHLSFVQRPSSWGQYRVSTRYRRRWRTSASSSSARRSIPSTSTRTGAAPTTISAIASSSTAPRPLSGFQSSGLVQCVLRAAVQHHLRRDRRSRARRAAPIVNGAFIPRNAGTGPDFFTASLRLSRTFRLGDRVRLEGLVEGFNLTNRTNVVTVNGNFGTGAYPANPSSSFGQVLGVGEPRSAQFGLRVRF